MKNFELGPLFHEYAALVIPKLHSDEISLVHQDYSQFLIGRIQEMKKWQIALPVIVCLAADGSLEDGVTIASAWAPTLFLESVSSMTHEVIDENTA